MLVGLVHQDIGSGSKMIRHGLKGAVEPTKSYLALLDDLLHSVRHHLGVILQTAGKCSQSRVSRLEHVANKVHT